MTAPASILDLPEISGCCLFPQSRCVDGPFMVQVEGAEFACQHTVLDSDQLTLVHFHGNGEAVADYIPWMPEALAGLGLNSLFVEYRAYGASTGRAQLAAMLGDGEAVLAAAGLAPERVIAFGRSIGSLYAIELVHRLPSSAGLRHPGWEAAHRSHRVKGGRAVRFLVTFQFRSLPTTSWVEWQDESRCFRIPGGSASGRRG